MSDAEMIPEFPPGESLDRLLGPASKDDVDALWSEHELADVWEHELMSDASIEAGYLGPIEAIECAKLVAAMQPPARTVGDVLWHDSPNPRVLELLIERAKRATTDADKRLPKPIARLIELMCLRILKPADVLPDEELKRHVPSGLASTGNG